MVSVGGFVTGRAKKAQSVKALVDTGEPHGQRAGYTHLTHTAVYMERVEAVLKMAT